MIHRFENFNLKEKNTFGIHALTEEYVVIDNVEEIAHFLVHYPANKPLLILGGGSNMLFTKDFKGTILKPEIMGYKLIQETEEFVFIEAGAGVEWDDLVEWTVTKGWGGLENLSLIPGTVGASPVQNIGAYGIEVKDTIESVEGLYLSDASKFVFSNTECQFDYRYSIFKGLLRNKCLVLKVIFKLRKKPVFVLNYGSIEEEVRKTGVLNLENVRKAVINIRKSKLPDHKEIGNAGSFFKNPYISLEKAEKLKQQYANLPLYPVANSLLKTSAAFLIDKAGWKGFRRGEAGVHDRQPLVLVNFGHANGKEIAILAKEIQEDVVKKFGIELEMEVNFI